ncbi:hypothetical protein BN903_76 [Halorubrum sp. AJ67]|nr:hypothetical protein BN903_76 [Halorubrum sp. AJ67]
MVTLLSFFRLFSTGSTFSTGGIETISTATQAGISTRRAGRRRRTDTGGSVGG